MLISSPMSAVSSGRQFDAWVVATVDPTGKRATVVCQCGAAAQIAVDALLSGESMAISWLLHRLLGRG